MSDELWHLGDEPEQPEQPCLDENLRQELEGAQKQSDPEAFCLSLNFNHFAQVAHRRSKEAGWWGTPELCNIPTKLCLIHSEVSEALEGYRKDRMDDHLPHRMMIEVELADVLIRVGDLAGRLGLDIDGAVKEKMAYNRRREDHRLETRNAQGGKSF